MTQDQIVRDILAAIRSVKSRAKASYAQGDLQAYAELMFDLLALEQCLVIHTELLVTAA